mmetsp:Transcript_15241/g.45138  ORF Transcript_15241/g.45138 Transcript_15241/m.45138 type:complete len:118 (-) Transcript_15241:712-1065(-)
MKRRNATRERRDPPKEGEERAKDPPRAPRHTRSLAHTMKTTQTPNSNSMHATHNISEDSESSVIAVACCLARELISWTEKALCLKAPNQALFFSAHEGILTVLFMVMTEEVADAVND